MTEPHGGRGMKNVKDSFTKVAKDVQNGSVIEIHPEAEWIAQLKRIAVDPCSPRFATDNIQPLCSGILRLRKLMGLKDSEIPWRKRKIERLFKDSPRTPCGFVLPNQQPTTKVSIDRTSFDDINHWNYPSRGVSPSIDDNSINDAPSMENRDGSSYLNSSKSNGSRRRHIKPLRLSTWLLSSIGDDHHQRKVIPVGPRFQADVPEWSGTMNISILIDAYKNESSNSKWLGSQVWPFEIKHKKTTEKVIGKGRSNSCSCPLPGSTTCIKRHTSTKRMLLQHEIGPTFYSWMFDEMGEQVLNLWSSKDQNAFELLVKMKPSSDGKDFVKRSLKRFPNKSRKEIINYYFNVYIPNRMSIQMRLPSMKVVDTDDEDVAQDSIYLGIQKKSKKGKLKVRNSKDVKHYLRS